MFITVLTATPIVPNPHTPSFKSNFHCVSTWKFCMQALFA